MHTATSPLILFDDVTVRNNNRVLFQQLNLRIDKSQHWGIFGASGSGKTSLLRVLSGQFSIAHGTFAHPFKHEEIALLTSDYHFKNKSGLKGEFFYQQRYNATMTDDVPTVRNVLDEAVAKTMTSSPWTLQRLIELFQLQSLLNEEIIKLSNGETKRLRLALLLTGNPKLLLLDTPLVGLDVKTRESFDRILTEIAAAGITLIMTLEPDEIPQVITHALVLDDFTIVHQFTQPDFDKIKPAEATIPEIDERLLSSLLDEEPSAHQQIISMHNVTIRYDERTILQNINWEVARGERWALKGPNGAGKSTLLSLVNGDNPQAYANDIVLFDRKKGSGETIWDIKRKIGYVSPELLHYFRTTQSCLDVVLSGLREGPFGEKITEFLREKAKKWMLLLGIEKGQHVAFKTASPTTQRLTLLARALLKNPPLLILDEPCQGLDKAQTRRIQHLLDQICHHSSVTLIYVTHYQQELPACISHVIALENGQRIE